MIASRGRKDGHTTASPDTRQRGGRAVRWGQTSAARRSCARSQHQAVVTARCCGLTTRASWCPCSFLCRSGCQGKPRHGNGISRMLSTLPTSIDPPQLAGHPVIPLVIPPGTTRPHRSALAGRATNLSRKDSTRQYPADDPLLSCKQQVGGSNPPPALKPRTCKSPGRLPLPPRRPAGPHHADRPARLLGRGPLRPLLRGSGCLPACEPPHQDDGSKESQQHPDRHRTTRARRDGLLGHGDALPHHRRAGCSIDELSLDRR